MQKIQKHHKRKILKNSTTNIGSDARNIKGGRMSEKTYYPKFKSSRVIQVVETIVCEGKGTEENIYRQVFYYSDLDGKLLAVKDTCPDKCNGL